MNVSEMRLVVTTEDYDARSPLSGHAGLVRIGRVPPRTRDG
jgi:hypothetical protein